MFHPPTNRRAAVLLHAGLAGLLLLASGCSDDSSGSKDETIKIGMLAPVAGPLADVGTSLENAGQLAVDKINASGKFDAKIELVVEDDSCDTQQGIAGAQKLFDKGVVALTGTYCSSVAVPVADLNLKRGKIPFISAAGSNPALTDEGGEVTYRMVTRDDQEAPAAVNYLHDVLGLTKIAVLHDNSTYAKGAAGYAADYAESIGLEVTFNDAVAPGQRDYSSTLSKIGSSGAEALIYTGYYPELGLMASQWKRLNLDYTLVGLGGALDPSLAKVAGSAVDDEDFLLVTLPTGDLLDNPDIKEFSADYEAEFGTAPGAFSAYAYDSLMVIAAALEATDGDTDAKALNKAVHDVKLDGTTGLVSYDAKGDRQDLTYAAISFKDGKMTIGQVCADGDWAKC